MPFLILIWGMPSNMGIKAMSNRTVKTVEGTQNILEIFKYKYITARSQTTDNT